VGVGLMLGPVLGSLIYGFMGYEDTFYVFTGFISLGAIVVIFLLPTSINFAGEESKDEKKQDENISSSE
jgi:hypothetical protein